MVQAVSPFCAIKVGPVRPSIGASVEPPFLDLTLLDDVNDSTSAQPAAFSSGAHGGGGS